MLKKQQENLGIFNKLYKDCFNSHNYLNYSSFLKNPLYFEKEQITLFFEKLFTHFNNLNLSRLVNLEYISFSDGSTTNYLLNQLTIEDFDVIDNLFFNQEFEDIKQIKKFINNQCSQLDNFMDKIEFFRPINNINLDEFNIDFTEIKKLSSNEFKYIKANFLKVFKEMSYGFYEKNFKPVGREYSIYVCNKEIVFYNLKLLYNYIFLIYKEILLNQKDNNLFYSIKNLQKYFPIILNDINLVSNYYANNSEFFHRLNKRNFTNFDMKEIILKSLEYNSNLYKNLNEDWKKDKDICEKLLNLNISNIALILRYGFIDNDNFKKYILNYFK